MIVRSQKIRKAANGAPCSFCGKADGTVVAAHLEGPRAHEFGKGRGIKPSDLCVAFLCLEHHKQFDNKEIGEDKWDRSEQFMACILRTWHYLWEQGVIKV